MARLLAVSATLGDGTITSTSDLTSPGEFVGTVAYMSPEQARGMQLDARTDLFSFGVLLYEMATGILPFRGDNSVVILEAILNRSPVPAIRINPHLPSDLDAVISRALTKDRERRYQSAAQISADLRRIDAQAAPSNVATSVPLLRPATNGEIVLLDKRNAHPDEGLLVLAEEVCANTVLRFS